jgi:hypothetical protein
MVILGRDYGWDKEKNTPIRNILVSNNLFEDIDAAKYVATGIGFVLSEGFSTNLTIQHNTVLSTGSLVSFENGGPGVTLLSNFRFLDNLGVRHLSGGGKVGTEALDWAASSWDFRRNVIHGVTDNFLGSGNSLPYPKDNFLPRNGADWPHGEIGVEWWGFIDAAAGNYRLRPDSPYKGRATDGSDIGADLDAIKRAIVD